MNRFSSLLILIGCIGIAGCAAQPGQGATTQSTSGRQCFTPREVSSFTGTVDRNADIKVGTSRFFRLELAGGCPDVDLSQRIGIRARGGGTFICEGFDAELIVPDTSGTQTCAVSAIHAISREQYFADNKR
jgi:uncharacterized protein DUF6491